jgi:phosphoribosylformylglycinamidine synthase
LQLKFGEHEVASLSMHFLHEGRPPVVREAVYDPAPNVPLDASRVAQRSGFNDVLLAILGSLNVCSKHWVIRQYDHEVQGGSVIKPLVGAANDGPSDAAVVRPVLTSRRGLVIACGMNPHYGQFDTYHMAASAIDEALRNCVAVGADPQRIAVLDNFCWGNTDRPATLGSLVRAALACRDLALELGTPFISGKDSLNNEFHWEDEAGTRHTLSIPPSLLISAMGQVDDVARCITMDLKEPGNRLYLVGLTRQELGGSHLSLVEQLTGGQVPQVDAALARSVFGRMHHAIREGLVRACHDLSEGGLAAAIAEMALAGRLGATLDLDPIQVDAVAKGEATLVRLFSESNTRFLCEVTPAHTARFEELLADVPHARLGDVTAESSLRIQAGGRRVIDLDIGTLRQAWQAPLQW